MASKLCFGKAAELRPQISTQNNAPEPTPQNGETQRHGGPKRPKNGPKRSRLVRKSIGLDFK